MSKTKTQHEQSKPVILILGAGNSKDKRIKFEASRKVGKGSPNNDFSKCEVYTHDIRGDHDYLHDLDELPYPWKTDEFDEIHAYEVLEHTGTIGDADFFFGQMQELWRILKPGGYLMITVPTWDSLEMWAIPDHKRPLPPQIFQFCNRKYVEKNYKRPMHGDYREWLGPMNFEICGVEEETGHCGIVLRKDM